MIIDSSALIAILQKEPEAGAFLACLSKHECQIAAPTLFEASMVIYARRGDGGLADLYKLMSISEIDVFPFTHKHVLLATIAFQKYGRGNHPAKLNFGDCISYAVAKEMGDLLLYKGDDFDKTDIEKVDWASCEHKDS
ncbi:MAG: type II toxin-antitoxin system VapC family toxin [Alphaproteobacteria bacterium]|nr:type II toxin-antitoxin system VapC family toxin [Alphaproteobacteria bacterium]